MFTMARPPRIQPTQALARAMSLSEMPPLPMSTPMVMKKGTAIRGKEEMPFTIRRQMAFRLLPMVSRQNTEDRPTA